MQAPAGPVRIGVAPCLDATGTLRAGRRTHYVDAALVDAVAEAGGLALLVPGPSRAGASEPALAALASARLVGLDGLLVPGGDDFEPTAPLPAGIALVPVAQAQLRFDRALLGAALGAGLPVLGVCYGMQLLALHHGGRLHHHLPADLPAADPHALDPEGGRHGIRVVAGSRLAGILGAEALEVNSRHHQAVAEPGAGLRVSARAPDGVIEAVEATGTGFALGVQWHPEDLDRGHRTALFGAFVAACRERLSPR